MATNSTFLAEEQLKIVQDGDVNKEAHTVNHDNIDPGLSIVTSSIEVEAANSTFLEQKQEADKVHNDETFDPYETFQECIAHNFSSASDNDTHTYSSLSLFPSSSSETSSIEFDSTNHVSYLVETFQPLIVQTIQARELIPHIYFLGIKVFSIFLFLSLLFFPNWNEHGVK